MTNPLLQGVSHLNHAAVKICSAQKTIYIDPFHLSSPVHDADIIFITHHHHDHLSPDDISAILKDDTVLIAPASIADKVSNLGAAQVIEVQPGEDYLVQDIPFQTVPAYNPNKRFHPKEQAWVGYVITVNGSRYYIAGDTDAIPEMNQIQADVAFLPVGGTYTMDAKEAAEAASVIKPKVAVPIHYGEVVGSLEDARNFVNWLQPDIQGIIL